MASAAWCSHFRFLFIEMAKDGLARGWGAEMDVGGFPSHGVEQTQFGIGATQGGEFDAGAVRAEAADDPASAQLDERIGTTDGAVDDGLVENFRRALHLVFGLRLSAQRLDDGTSALASRAMRPPCQSAMAT